MMTERVMKMEKKKCVCEGVTRKGEWPVEAVYYPGAKKIVFSSASVDLTGQTHNAVIEVKMEYCPECGRKL